jgi:O-antigen/teichoic acid export membrane protein
VLEPVWPEPAILAELWRFSMPLLLSSALGIVAGPALVLAILKQVRTFDEVGIYSFSQQLTGVLQQLAIIVGTVLLPHLSVMVDRGEDEQIRRLIRRVVPYGVLAIALVFGIAGLVGWVAIPLLFGAAFAPAVPVVIVLIVGSTALAFFSVFVPFMNAYGWTWAITRISVVTSAVTGGTVLLLAPRYGAGGGAVAVALGSVAAAMLTLVTVQRRLGVEAARVVLPSLPVVAAAVPLLLVPAPYTMPVAAVALLVSAYLVVAALFDEEDLAALDRAGMPAALRAVLVKLVPWIGRPLVSDGR